MEKVQQLLSSSSSSSSLKRNEEKIAAIMLLNQLFPQIIAKYEQPPSTDSSQNSSFHYKQPSYDLTTVLDSVFSFIYDHITPSFIVNLLLSKKFPAIQKAAIEFLSYHTLQPSSSFLTRYQKYYRNFTQLYLESLQEQSNSNEFSEHLAILIKHLVLIGDADMLVTCLRELLASPSLSRPPLPQSSSQNLSDLKKDEKEALRSSDEIPLLSIVVDLLRTYSMRTMITENETEDKEKTLEHSQPICVLTSDEIQKLDALLMVGLRGAAPETVRDETLQNCKELLHYSAVHIISVDWLFHSISTVKHGSSPSDPPTSFLSFLTSIVMNEMHLLEEEILCCYNELINEQSTEKEILQHRYYRCSKAYVLCLEIMEGILKAALPVLDSDEGRQSTEQLLKLQTTLQQIVKEILTFTMDSSSVITSSSTDYISLEEQDNLAESPLAMLRAVTSRSLHFLRIYRREDNQLTNQILNGRGKLLLSSLLLKTSAQLATPPTRAFFFKAKQDQSSSPVSMDSSLMLLLLFNDITEDITNHLIHKEEQLQLDQIIDVHSVLVSFLIHILKYYSLGDSSTKLSRQEDQLLIESIIAGLTLTDSIILMKYVELKDLLNCEGADAFYNIVGIQKEQIKELYEQLKKLTENTSSRVEDEMSRELVHFHKLCGRLESLALEDVWTDTLE